jgi:hypothetical protein
VAVGRQHGLAVSTEGYVYSWGGTNLVSGRDGNVEIPALVEGDLKGRRMMLVAAGEVRRDGCGCWGCLFWCCLWCCLLYRVPQQVLSDAFLFGMARCIRQC